MKEKTVDKSTKPYRPSNSTEGAWFEREFCSKCEYSVEERKPNADMADSCHIHGSALAFGIDEPGYPAEWVSDPDGSKPRCTKFRLEGTGTWEQAAADQERYEQAMADMREAQLEQARRDQRNTDHELLDDVDAEQRLEAEAEERRALENAEMAKHYERNPHG